VWIVAKGLCGRAGGGGNVQRAMSSLTRSRRLKGRVCPTQIFRLLTAAASIRGHPFQFISKSGAVLIGPVFWLRQPSDDPALQGEPLFARIQGAAVCRAWLTFRRPGLRARAITTYHAR